MLKYWLSAATVILIQTAIGGTGLELQVPDNLSASDISSEGFLASWHDEDYVDGYDFGLWHLIWQNWHGNRKWRETFARCICQNSVDKAISEEEIDQFTDNSGWCGDAVYLAAGFNGKIKVGKTTATGTIVSPPLPDLRGLVAVLRARAYKTQPNMRLGIIRISGDVTNLMQEVTLTTKMTDYALTNLEIAAGDKLALRSFTTGKQRRVLLDSLEFVSDYVSGETIEEAVGETITVSPSFVGGSHCVSGLTPGESYRFRVRARLDNQQSAWSDSCRVDLAGDSGMEDMLNVSPARLAEGGFTLSWNRIVNAESYRVTVWANEVSDGILFGPSVMTTNVQDLAGYADAVYDYAVEALAIDGATLTCETNRVDVSKLPQLPVLEAISVSGLAEANFTEDFSSLQTAFPKKDDSTADWLNGVTMRYWQAYQDGESPPKLRRNLGKLANGGLYAYWNGSDADTYSLGMNVGSDNEEYVCGVVFENDRDDDIGWITISYEGRQFGFRNTVEQRIDLELLVTNRMVAISEDGGWQRVERLATVTPASKDDGLVSGETMPVSDCVQERMRIKVPAGHYLAIRWRREHVTNAAAFAIDNIGITLENDDRGMAVLLR